jgi:hypothetical protein
MPPLWPDPIWEKIDPAQELSPLATEGPCLRLGLLIRNQAANKFLNHKVVRLIDCYPSRRERHAGVTRIDEAEEHNLDIEIVSVPGKPWPPFAIQQRTMGKLNEEQIMVPFVPSSSNVSKADPIFSDCHRHVVA